LKLLAALLGLLTCGPGPARGETALALARLPLSARQQASGGTYGAYDVLGVAENPATLITQPRELAVNATDLFLMSNKENVLGLGVGWMTGTLDTGAWGLALVADQVSTAAFDVVDELGNATGEHVRPVTRRLDLAGAYQRFGLAIGGSAGFSSESYGSLAGGSGAGPHGAQVAAGILMPFAGGSAGAALLFPGLGSRDHAGIADLLNAGGSMEALGLILTAGVAVPLSRPAGPSASAGVRWPVVEALDLMAAYSASFVSGVPLALGSSVRAGFSLRSIGLGMDYTLVVPLVSGPGLTQLIALGWDFGDARPRPVRAPVSESPAPDTPAAPPAAAPGPAPAPAAGVAPPPPVAPPAAEPKW